MKIVLIPIVAACFFLTGCEEGEENHFHINNSQNVTIDMNDGIQEDLDKLNPDDSETVTHEAAQ